MKVPLWKQEGWTHKASPCQGPRTRGHKLELWSKTKGLQKTMSHKFMKHTASWGSKDILAGGCPWPLKWVVALNSDWRGNRSS